MEALQRNLLADVSDLFVYSDAAKSEAAMESVAEVRAYLRGIEGFRSVTVIERDRNWGVDPSVIDGVTTLCQQFGRAIVLEDDLVTSPWFLTYMNRALDLYQNEDCVMQVSGFMFPNRGFAPDRACFLPFMNSWGWATWKRAWKKFDPTAAAYESLRRNGRRRYAFNLHGAYDYFNMLEQFVQGNLDAWDIRWYLSIFDHGGLTLFPQKSLVRNIGFDGSGEHCPSSDFAGTEISDVELRHFPAVAIDLAAQKAVEAYLISQRDKGFKPFIRHLLGGHSSVSVRNRLRVALKRSFGLRVPTK